MTVQVEMVTIPVLDFLFENPGCSHRVLRPATVHTFSGAVKEFCVFCQMDDNIIQCLVVKALV